MLEPLPLTFPVPTELKVTDAQGRILRTESLPAGTDLPERLRLAHRNYRLQGWTVDPLRSGRWSFLVIIGLLAAVVVPEVIGQVERARVTKARQDIQSFETALAMFQLDNSKYPTTDQGLTALVQQPTDPSIRQWRRGGYLQHISKDPWGSDYHYEYPGTHGKEYDVYTLGADNQLGGEGANADIGNWNVSD